MVNAVSIAVYVVFDIFIDWTRNVDGAANVSYWKRHDRQKLSLDPANALTEPVPALGQSHPHLHHKYLHFYYLVPVSFFRHSLQKDY